MAGTSQNLSSGSKAFLYFGLIIVVGSLCVESEAKSISTRKTVTSLSPSAARQILFGRKRRKAVLNCFSEGPRTAYRFCRCRSRGCNCFDGWYTIPIFRRDPRFRSCIVACRSSCRGLLRRRKRVRRG